MPPVSFLLNMHRSNSVTSNSNISVNNILLNSALSPLIKLERLIYRLSSILSIDFSKFNNEFELENHLKLLLEVRTVKDGQAS